MEVYPEDNANYVPPHRRCVPGKVVGTRPVPDGKGRLVEMRIYQCQYCDHQDGRSNLKKRYECSKRSNPSAQPNPPAPVSHPC